MRPPVALVTPRYHPAIGGVERHVQALAGELVRRGVPVEVLTTDPSGGLPSQERLDGILVRRFPTLRGDARYFISPVLARWLWRHASAYRLLHAHNYQSLVPLAAAIGARGRRVPLVVTPHYHAAAHTPMSALLHLPYRLVARRMLRHAGAVIAVSAAERGWLERDFGDLPLFVLPNGVDLPPADRQVDPFPARVPGERTLLSVGRLEPYKGVARIVTALPHLPDARLVVIGEGSASGAVRETAVRLGVSDRVQLAGHVTSEDLARWYATADLFLTLSRQEAFGMTVLEAAAAGAPVLASAIPAHREVRSFVADGRIALVEPDSEGERLAAAITEAARMGRSVDRTGWRLPTWEAMASGVMAAYAELLDEPLGGQSGV